MCEYKLSTALLLVIGIIAAAPAQTWTIEQVTDNAEDDTNPLITATSSGLVIAYTHNDGDDEEFDEVFIANNFSGSWTTERLTDNTRQDEAYDIAANYNEQDVHLAVWWDDDDADYSGTSHFWGSPGSWNSEIIADNDSTHGCSWPNLAIDESGFIHMVYSHSIEYSKRQMYYTNNITGSWVTEQITDKDYNIRYSSLALDPDGNPHIVYYDSYVYDYYYLKKIDGIWTTLQLTRPRGDFMSSPSLALDSAANCHFAYTKKFFGDIELYYVNNADGSWEETRITANNDDDITPSLLIDPNQKAHIVYVTRGDEDPEISYANNVDGVWTIERITENNDTDAIMWNRVRHFIAGNDGIGHIVFSNNSDGDYEIYHAYSNSSIFEAVEESKPVSDPASIWLDGDIFSTTTTIKYSIPHNGNVSLRIYDVSGSLVKTLVDGSKPQGEHAVTWDGETDTGNHASPGVYFINLIADGEKASAKVVLK